MAKGMITSAIVLSKISVTKIFKRRLAGGFSIFEKLIKTEPKVAQNENLFLEKQSRFHAWECHQDKKIFPLMLVFIFSNSVS